ncbi:M48 family metallopeptidase [Methylobacterium sp. sgz302541]|uniref:M48 family metallopeptidase n=1 Tax=unclassified Methylobacterium TaxID=2615210 RepID=UPI003D3256D8
MAQEIVAAGSYFDGVSARPHPVTLRLGDRLVISGAGIFHDWNPIDIRASETLPPLMRIGVVGSLARVEFEDATLAAVLPTRCPDLRKAEDGTHGTLRIVGWSVAAGLSVLAAAVYGMPLLAALIAPLVPAPVEAKLGEAVDGQVVRILGDPPLCAEPAGQAVLDALVARMTAGQALPPGLSVVVRRHAKANALTLPGARIVVLSDIIAKARTPDEFAGVLAHEFGHAAARDPTRALIQTSGSSFLLSLVLGDLTGSTVIVAVGQAALAAGYSRDAERAADAYSVAMMNRAGGDGAALASILERIAKDGSETGAFLRSHPFTRERAAAIRALAGPDAAGRRILSDADWTALRGICPPLPGKDKGKDKPKPEAPEDAPRSEGERL